MNEDQLSMYSAYMSTLGNREDLFPGSGYVDKYIENPPDDYTVNAAYLTDEKFATLIAEAEKYLGYPYVWGGSNPSTSFDCSGFVSYVLTNSGLVNTGRLGAQGLYDVCSPVSSADVKPGDLVFFVGTYDTPGVSHVGIYVGDNVMLHCGDPIQYTSINTSYFKFIKQKPKTKGSDDLDDYDYGADEELPEDETWETEPEEADGGGDEESENPVK